MQDIASVLPDHGFVQMAAAVHVKFKSSVARGMHLAAGIPNWNIKASGTRPRPSRRYLPLTAVKAAGFNPIEAGGQSDGRRG
jgi:hypothetical protein